MDEYIKKSDALQAIEAGNVHSGIISAMQSLIEDVLPADVEEVKHGEWITEYTSLDSHCSKCNSSVNSCFADIYIRCPFCGAVMDGKESKT